MLAVADRRGRMILELFASELVLASIAIVSVAVMVAMAAIPAGTADRWPALLVIVFAAFAMVWPDTEAALVTLLAYGTWWLAVAGSASWAAGLTAALACLAFHLALAFAAAAPPGARFDGSTARTALRDAGLIGLGTGTAAVIIVILQETQVHAAAVVIGVALLLIGLLPWVAALNHPEAGAPTDDVD